MRRAAALGSAKGQGSMNFTLQSYTPCLPQSLPVHLLRPNLVAVFDEVVDRQGDPPLYVVARGLDLILQNFGCDPSRRGFKARWRKQARTLSGLSLTADVATAQPLLGSGRPPDVTGQGRTDTVVL